MSEYLNDLKYDNTKITFNQNTNNIATSDELTATPLYQDKMGTAYSKSKAVVRAFNMVGISLILTATAIKTGSLISNVFILNPPTISEKSYLVEDGTFKATFTISNSGKYRIDYHLFINDEEVLNEECSNSETYEVTYSHLEDGDSGHFYIAFSNRVDYQKTIETFDFKVEV